MAWQTLFLSLQRAKKTAWKPAVVITCVSPSTWEGHVRRVASSTKVWVKHPKDRCNPSISTVKLLIEEVHYTSIKIMDQLLPWSLIGPRCLLFCEARRKRASVCLWLIINFPKCSVIYTCKLGKKITGLIRKETPQSHIYFKKSSFTEMLGN